MDNKWFIDIIKLDSKPYCVYILFGMRSLQNENE